MTNTVLITGTSSGIGLATAVASARAGWRTVATMRDTTRATALRDAVAAAGVAHLVDILPLDVTDPDAAAACVADVIAKYGRLDAVINNAGAGHLGTLEQESIDDIRAVFEVNFFGVLHVTRAALPHLRATGGRVLAVTSVGGVIGQPFNEAYCAAKFAVEGFLESLAPVVAAHGVWVTVVEPGAVASEFVANVGAIQVDSAGPYASQLSVYLDRTRAAFDSAQSTEEAAAPIIDALTADRPAFRVQTSEGARGFASVKLADLDGSTVQTLTTAWVS